MIIEAVRVHPAKGYGRVYYAVRLVGDPRWYSMPVEVYREQFPKF